MRRSVTFTIVAAATCGVLAGTARIATSSGQAGALVRLQSSFPGVTQAGDLHISGRAGAYEFVGRGASLTDLDASALLTGTVPDGRLSESVALLNRVGTFSSPQTFASMPQFPVGAATGRVLTSLNNTGSAGWQEPTIAVPFDKTINTINPSYGFRIVNAGNAASIRGETSSPAGVGLAGVATSTSGTNYGVFGSTASPSGIGVYGSSFATSGLATGVRGYVSTTQGVGVEGISSTGGFGGSFQAMSGIALFAYGQMGGSFRSDVGTALQASSFASSGTGYAGNFETASSTGIALRGSTTTTSGASTGVLGVSVSPNGVGVEGRNTAGGIAVYGIASGSNAFAGYFSGRGYFEGNVGIGTTTPSDRLELRGGSSPTSMVFQPGKHYGVDAANKATIDIPGTADLLFWDNVHVNNTFTAGAKNFRIDHPLDPYKKFLQHSCVESNEYKNLYDGTVITNQKGYATVTVPDWFTALNENFRYQLTVIEDEDSDGFIMAKVCQKLKGNSFTMRTSQPGVEVSWQVTGVRKDPYAKENPLRVEEDKPDYLQGRLIHPVRAKVN